MFVSQLTEIELKNMLEFKYTSQDNSVLYNYIFSPLLNKVVNFLPYNLAPNLITIGSLVMNILAALVTALDSGYDFNKSLKSSTCIIMGTTQMLYFLFDNIDGKQARRTGTSSPYGMLLDHGCDIFTNILTTFNLAHLLLVGNEGLSSLSVFLGLLTGFFASTYEEYVIGYLNLPLINGADEGNIAICLGAITFGFTGTEFLRIKTFIFDLSIGQLAGFSLLFGGIFCLLQCILHTYIQKPDKLKSLFFDWLLIFIFFSYPIIFIYLKQDMYNEYGWIVTVITALFFARETMITQITIVTEMIFSNSIYMYIISALTLCTLFLPNYPFSYFVLLGFATFIGIELISFIVSNSKTVLNFLGLSLLTINPQISTNEQQIVIISDSNPTQ